MKILNLISYISFQSPELFEKFKDDEILTISPLTDPNLDNFIKCEIGSLSYVLAMIASEISTEFSDFDTGLLSGESSVGEEEIPEILEFIKDLDYVLIDENAIKFHADKVNMEHFLNLIAKDAQILGLNGSKIEFKNTKFNELKELQSFDGAVVLKHTKNLNFVGGPYFSMSSKLKDGDEVEISGVKRVFKLDKNLKGTVALLGVESVNSYIYEVAKFSKVQR
ncbi:MAG: hypothetical protein GXZ15_00530 [Campylobacter sp.]|nr:hypothetical protein [Campylobacter sp.]